MAVVVIDRYHNNEVKPFTEGNDGYTHLRNGLKGLELDFVEAGNSLASIIKRLGKGDVLWIPYPKHPFSKEEVDAIKEFLQKGGGLFLSAEWGDIYSNATILNGLLEKLGSDIRVNPDRVSDEKNALTQKTYFMGEVMEEKKLVQYIRIRSFNHHITTRDVKEIHYASGCSLTCPEKKVIARTEASAFSDRDANRKMDGDEEFGTFPIAAWDIIGQGRVIVVGDSSTPSNRYIKEGDNEKFILNIFRWLARKD